MQVCITIAYYIENSEKFPDDIKSPTDIEIEMISVGFFMK